MPASSPTGVCTSSPPTTLCSKKYKSSHCCQKKTWSTWRSIAGLLCPITKHWQSTKRLSNQATLFPIVKSCKRRSERWRESSATWTVHILLTSVAISSLVCPFTAMFLCPVVKKKIAQRWNVFSNNAYTYVMSMGICIFYYLRTLAHESMCA